MFRQLVQRGRSVLSGCWSRTVSRPFRNNQPFPSVFLLTRRYSTQQQDAHEKRKLWMLVIPVTTFCLGTWQIFRLQWKLGLMEELERKTRKQPINIPSNIMERLEELEYRRVRLHGHYDHTKELYMWPRALLNEDVGSHKRESEPGAYVITPFYCHEIGGYVLVNRGWVPMRKMDPKTRQQGQVEGETTLLAVVRNQEKRPPFTPKNDEANNHWSFRDVAAMATCAETTPILLDADATTTVPGGPIGGQTRITLRNEHLQYVFTWYALSLVTFYMFWKFWNSAKKRRNV